MNINKEELLKIANLARIEIPENEIEEYLKNLEDILEFTNILSSVDLTETDDGANYLSGQNKFRKDEIVNFDNKEIIFENAETIENNMFKVPKVI